MDMLHRMDPNKRVLVACGLPVAGLILFLLANWSHLQTGADVSGGSVTLSLIVCLVLAVAGCVVAVLSKEAKAESGDQRLISTLGVCQANVMVADNDFNIVYVNESAMQMLQSNQAELQKQLPGFNASSLVGTNIDIFHKNPAHQRSMVHGLSSSFTTEIKVSGLTFGLIATPIKDENGVRLGTVVEWKDKTQELAKRELELQQANDNTRVRQALDTTTTNAMIADQDGNIVYCNQSVTDMLNTAERDIRKALPNFRANDVVGSNFDIFHKNPSHQRNMLATLKSTYQTQIEVGGRYFKLVANPIFNEHNDRIGTVVEWTDQTAEVAIQNEISKLVKQAGDGDLSVRLNTNDKEGFMLSLSKGLNDIMDVTDEVTKDLGRVLAALADGDLTKTITANYKGSFGRLKDDANTTVSKLIETISEIAEAASTVAQGVQEIAQGNADLSQRTEEQASSLEETASSMEQMTSTVKQSSQNAMEANTLASEAQKKAEQGGSVVAEAVTAMGEINASSKKIADIIGVIDEIAFQTNLLALNAAVEAARAGEQGRGFAVVAGEVRSLAQRSAGAAKEIKDLIRDSVTKVENGAKLVNLSGETLDTIVDSVKQVSAMMAEISTASMEQTSGIEQVNVAVSQMDEMTQQNAALVEQASATGEALADQASQLRQQVSFFKMNEGSLNAGYAGGNSAPIKSYNPASASPVKPATSSKAATKKSKTSTTPPHQDDSDDCWEEF